MWKVRLVLHLLGTKFFRRYYGKSYVVPICSGTYVRGPHKNASSGSTSSLSCCPGRLLLLLAQFWQLVLHQRGLIIWSASWNRLHFTVFKSARQLSIASIVPRTCGIPIHITCPFRLQLERVTDASWSCGARYKKNAGQKGWSAHCCKLLRPDDHAYSSLSVNSRSSSKNFSVLLANLRKFHCIL